MSGINVSQDEKNKPLYKKIYFQVVVGIILGISVGHFFPDLGSSLKPLGTGFIKLIKMIIAPIIFLTVAHGIGAMTDVGKLKHVGSKAIIYFMVLSTLALGFGLVAANLIRPGDGLNIDPSTLSTEAISSYIKSGKTKTIADHILHIIPDTFFSAFTQGEVIQVLFVAILFGLALMKIGKPAKGIVDGMGSVLHVIFKIVNMLMQLAPIGAFGGMAYTIGEYGFASLKNLFVLVATFYVTGTLFVFTALAAVCWYHKIPMFKFFSYLKDELLLVLGTSSSEPAFPSTMHKLEKAGCSESAIGLILPMGYSFNLTGINIYMTLAALFIAQATNIPLDLEQQLAILMVAIISSKGAAGVTGAGFIILASTLSSVGTIPVAGMTLILGVDRFMSECRALVSFIGNAITAAAVAKATGEMDYNRFMAVMNDHDIANDDYEFSYPTTDDKIWIEDDHTDKVIPINQSQTHAYKKSALADV